MKSIKKHFEKFLIVNKRSKELEIFSRIVIKVKSKILKEIKANRAFKFSLKNTV